MADSGHEKLALAVKQIIVDLQEILHQIDANQDLGSHVKEKDSKHSGAADTAYHRINLQDCLSRKHTLNPPALLPFKDDSLYWG